MSSSTYIVSYNLINSFFFNKNKNVNNSFILTVCLRLSLVFWACSVLNHKSYVIVVVNLNVQILKIRLICLCFLFGAKGFRLFCKSIARLTTAQRFRPGFPKVVHMDPLGAILTIRGGIEIGKRKRFKINKQRN